MREMTMQDTERNDAHGPSDLGTSGVVKHRKPREMPGAEQIALDDSAAGAASPAGVAYNSQMQTPVGPSTVGADTPDVGAALQQNDIVKQIAPDPGSVRMIGRVQ